LIKDVPYVTASRDVRENGVLVSKLQTEIADGHERTKKPAAHVAYWIGEHPCHANGEKIRPKTRSEKLPTGETILSETKCSSVVPVGRKAFFRLSSLKPAAAKTHFEFGRKRAETGTDVDSMNDYRNVLNSSGSSSLLRRVSRSTVPV
jgi:hypothetical protein